MLGVALRTTASKMPSITFASTFWDNVITQRRGTQLSHSETALQAATDPAQSPNTRAPSLSCSDSVALSLCPINSHLGLVLELCSQAGRIKHNYISGLLKCKENQKYLFMAIPNMMIFIWCFLVEHAQFLQLFFVFSNSPLCPFHFAWYQAGQHQVRRPFDLLVNAEDTTTYTEGGFGLLPLPDAAPTTAPKCSLTFWSGFSEDCLRRWESIHSWTSSCRDVDLKYYLLNHCKDRVRL